ncbi:hypothetical protein EGH24_12430 [Halonotius terrestris]|uniref:Uncharacterized protein n=1 Tax=Halonotius terrestris TaxID=2487750 RepID=A0A8J8P8A1_9EURY|nr:hypothetical protein [Halonotius terrestris]TQQ79190.1 hypothetical protein EGH24_12430 [Halonotius terrestris]
MSEDNQSSGEDRDLDSVFGVLDDSVIAAINFSAFNETLKAVQHLQELNFFTKQLPAIAAMQQGTPDSAYLSLHHRFQQDIPSLTAIHWLQQLPELKPQRSLGPALVSSTLNQHTLSIQKMLPAIRSIQQPVMPSMQFFQAIDNIQSINYAVSEFATTATYNTSFETQPESVDIEGTEAEPVVTEKKSNFQWTKYDSLELYYNFSAILLDEAINATGVRDLSDKQRIGICLTVAIMFYVSSNKRGAFQSLTPAAFLYAMLRDLGNE